MPPDNKESSFTPVPISDSEMLAAMQRARETFPDFLREIEADLHRIIPALSSVLVKAYFSDADNPDGGEHMWVADVESDGRTIVGKLCDTPAHVRCVQRGKLVHFPLEQLSDWLYVSNNKAHGAFTVRALRNRLSEAEKQAHDHGYPFSFE